MTDLSILTTVKKFYLRTQALFITFYNTVCVLSCSVVSDSLRRHGLQPTRLLCLCNFPGKNTRADCHFLLQGSSWPRDQTCISCVSGTGRWILYYCAPYHQRSSSLMLRHFKKGNSFLHLCNMKSKLRKNMTHWLSTFGFVSPKL